jgi:chemotaxis protein MotB
MVGRSFQEVSHVTRSKAFRLCLLTSFILATATQVGCGHTDEEMAEKQRMIDKLSADLKDAQQRDAEDLAKYKDAQGQINLMNQQIADAHMSAEKMKQALDEYKQRAEQLAAIEGRFRQLRQRLEALTKVGLKVVVRNNRMVIQLPGDVLFDSGKDQLKLSGKQVLAQVSDVIRGDSDLSKRNFQVAGHTDNQQYPVHGPFGDNWGLSLARARQVLLYMISPNTAKPGKPENGGGLDPRHWAASGYGDTDPQAGSVESQTPEQMSHNRRVELVLQPNVEEMINLNNIQ